MTFRSIATDSYYGNYTTPFLPFNDSPCPTTTVYGSETSQVAVEIPEVCLEIIEVPEIPKNPDIEIDMLITSQKVSKLNYIWPVLGFIATLGVFIPTGPQMSPDKADVIMKVMGAIALFAILGATIATTKRCVKNVSLVQTADKKKMACKTWRKSLAVEECNKPSKEAEFGRQNTLCLTLCTTAIPIIFTAVWLGIHK